MLDFLGVTEHFSCMENTPFSFPALFRDMAGEAVSLDGVIFSGSIVSANQEVVEISIEKGESSNEVIFSFPALPEGRWSYNVLVQADDGSQRILFSGYISVLGVSRVTQLAGDPPMKNRTLLVAMPGEATMRLRMEWMATTAAQAFAVHALQASKNAHADAETATNAAGVATGASATATERAKEAEGYAGSAHASETAAANFEAAAATSAANAARDAKNVHNNKTAMESLASAWPQTVSNAEQTIVAAKEDALSSIQTKQADSVLAVGRASQTAQQNITGAQTEAVAAVQTAKENAVGTITPLVQRAETAQEAVTAAEGRINTAEANANTSATNAAASATAAQQALEAIPQVDAAGNMTLSGGLTAAGVINANGGVRIPEPTALTASTVLGWSGLMGMSALEILFKVKAIQSSGELKAGAGSVTQVIGGNQFAVPKGNVGSFLVLFNLIAGTNPESSYGGVCGFCLPFSLYLPPGAKIKLSTPMRYAFTQNYDPSNFDVYSTQCNAFVDVTFERLEDETYDVRTRARVLNRKLSRYETVTTSANLPKGLLKTLWWVQPSAYKDECGIYVLHERESKIYKISESHAVETFEYSGIRALAIDVQSSSDQLVKISLADAEIYKLYATPGMKKILDAVSINKISNVEVEPIS